MTIQALAFRAGEHIAGSRSAARSSGLSPLDEKSSGAHLRLCSSIRSSSVLVAQGEDLFGEDVRVTSSGSWTS